MRVKKKKSGRYLLFPPHLSSLSLLPPSHLRFWLALLSWSWRRSCDRPHLRPRSRRTPPHTLSSCHERGLSVDREEESDQERQQRNQCFSHMDGVTGYLLEMRLLGSSSSSSPLSSCTASSGMACIWTPGAWGSIRRFSNRRCLEGNAGIKKKN